ncbi:MAG: hypothetical protein GXO01_03700 [Epsilonproteobacteria bacterium]|nr:hypothetical protein [Campylobacterota bacterium]
MKKIIIVFLFVFLSAGTFNVVNDDFSKTTGNTVSTNPKSTDNLLYTQIVYKPFKFKVIHLADDNQTLEDYKGVVIISVVDYDYSPNNPNAAPDIPNTFRKVIFRNKSVVEVGNPKLFAIPIGVKRAKFRMRYLINVHDGLAFRWTNEEECKNQIEGNQDITFSCIWKVMDAEYGDEAQQCLSSAQNGEIIPNCFCAQECSYVDKINPLSNKKNEVANNQCLACLFGHWGNIVYSRDDFAVRPYQFIIDGNATYSKLRAGQSYMIKMRAVGYPLPNPVPAELIPPFTGMVMDSHRRIPVWDYNETITIRGHSPSLEYNDTNASKGCNPGILSIVNPVSAKFRHGVAFVQLQYNEVGDLNMTLKEFKDGYEYAKIDESDSVNPNGVLIQEGSKVITFIPFAFSVVNINFQNGANGFTYISRDLNMSAKLTFRIKALNMQGTVTKNYKANCYANNVDLNITHNVPLPLASNFIYKEENYSIKEKNNNLPLDVVLIKDKFINGEADANISINFKKDYRNPNNPFNLILSTITAIDKNDPLPLYWVLSPQVPVNKSVQYLYGRINIPNIAGYSSVLYNNASFEYYKSGKWYINKNHTSAIYGDINISKTIIPYVSISLGTLNGGYQEIKYQPVGKNPPFGVIGHYSINSWLWYQIKAQNYQDPSSSNVNCKTHPCNKIDFLAVNGGWAGIGDNNSKYAPDKNQTVQITNKTENNTSKSVVKSINW